MKKYCKHAFIISCSAALAATFSSVILWGCGSSVPNTSAPAHYEAAAEADYGVYDKAEETAADMQRSGQTDEPAVDTPYDIVAGEKKLIRNVDFSFEAEGFDSFISGIEEKVKECGGYVENSDIYGQTQYKSLRNAYYIVRIPSNKLDYFIDYAEGTGHLTRKSESTQDITLTYRDTELRKETLKTEQQRLLELLGKAESMDAVIALEARLSDIRYQLDSFESNLRRYDNQVQYSTVNISIQERRVLTQSENAGFSERVRAGLSSNLLNIRDSLINFAVFFLSYIPQVLIAALTAFFVFLVSRSTIRRKTARREKPGKDNTKKMTEAQSNGDEEPESKA